MVELGGLQYRTCVTPSPFVVGLCARGARVRRAAGPFWSFWVFLAHLFELGRPLAREGFAPEGDPHELLAVVVVGRVEPERERPLGGRRRNLKFTRLTQNMGQL